MSINQDKLHEFLGRAITDFGATFNAALIRIGDKLGLYKALVKYGPQTPAELAKNTGTMERYVREWLSAQAAGGYVTYDAETGNFHLNEEQAFTMADETSPVFLPGAFQVALAAIQAEEKIAERFKTGEGLGWHEHHHSLFEGTERFFRPGYAANLINAWIPALEGVEQKLKKGGKAADVGCGLGASTILMAQAYPNSEFVGFDYHDKSIEAAKQRANAAEILSGNGLRFRDVLRLLARYGRSRRRVHARAQFVEERWDVDDRGAVCRGQTGRKLESYRARVLWRVDALVHPGFAFAGSWSRAGRAGRRKAFARSSHVGGIYALPARNTNSIQFDF
jgi:SAM-dependent methyltransferase